MRRLLSVFAVMSLLAVAGCSKCNKNKAEAPKMDEVPAAPAEVPPPPAPTPAPEAAPAPAEAPSEAPAN